MSQHKQQLQENVFKYFRILLSHAGGKSRGKKEEGRGSREKGGERREEGEGQSIFSEDGLLM